jgi:hypothetical protein
VESGIGLFAVPLQLPAGRYTLHFKAATAPSGSSPTVSAQLQVSDASSVLAASGLPPLQLPPSVATASCAQPTSVAQALPDIFGTGGGSGTSSGATSDPTIAEAEATSQVALQAMMAAACDALQQAGAAANPSKTSNADEWLHALLQIAAVEQAQKRTLLPHSGQSEDDGAGTGSPTSSSNGGSSTTNGTDSSGGLSLISRAPGHVAATGSGCSSAGAPSVVLQAVTAVSRLLKVEMSAKAVSAAANFALFLFSLATVLFAQTAIDPKCGLAIRC